MRNIFTLQSYFLERDVRTLNGYQEFFDNTDIPELKKATQALLVNGLGGIYADVGFYEKGSGKWKPDFTTYAFVGKSGFLPNKKEGDGGSPEGVFRFTHAFGINEDPGCSAFPYFKVTDDDYWCGISGTPYYNQPVKASEHPELGLDRDNSEHLIDYDPGYQYAMNISWNEDGVPDRGSAIFLHCIRACPWTNGCVALPERRMIELLQKVKKDCVVVMGLHIL